MARSWPELLATLCGPDGDHCPWQVTAFAARVERFWRGALLPAMRPASEGALRVRIECDSGPRCDFAARGAGGGAVGSALPRELPRPAQDGTRVYRGRSRWDHDLHRAYGAPPHPKAS